MVRRYLKSISDRITRTYIRLTSQGGADVEQFASWSGRHTVYWYSEPSDKSLGKNVPFMKSIVLNKSRLDELSLTVSKFVVEHEVGHKRRFLITGIIYPTLVLSLITLAGMRIIFTLFNFGPMVFGQFSFLPQQLSTTSLVVGLIGLVVIRRLEELLAEIHVLQYVTDEIYLECHEEIANQRPIDLLTRIQKNVAYVKPERVLWYRDQFERFKIL